MLRRNTLPYIVVVQLRWKRVARPVPTLVQAGV